MSETSAPWRVLEDVPAAGSGAQPGGAGPASADRRLPVPWWIAGALVVAALLIGAAIVLVVSGGQGSVAVEGGGSAGADDRSPDSRGSPATSATGAGGELVIDVQGAVLRPGVVRLPPGSRVADAIAAAGGYGPRVAVERVGQVLNLAATLHDGDQVVVPSRDDPAVGSAAPGQSALAGSGGSGGPVDLNRATAAELDALPGIGPVTAAKIIAARDEQPFASLDDLRTRKVLGAATLEKIKDLVVVR